MFDNIMEYDTGKDYTQFSKDKDEEIMAFKIKIKELEETVDLLGKPCKCNPVGSGEEYCNGGCEMREEIETLKNIIEKSIDSHGMTRVLKHRIEELKEGLSEIKTFIDELDEDDYNNPRESKMAFDAIKTTARFFMSYKV